MTRVVRVDAQAEACIFYFIIVLVVVGVRVNKVYQIHFSGLTSQVYSTAVGSVTQARLSGTRSLSWARLLRFERGCRLCYSSSTVRYLESIGVHHSVTACHKVRGGASYSPAAPTFPAVDKEIRMLFEHTISPITPRRNVEQPSRIEQVPAVDKEM